METINRTKCYINNESGRPSLAMILETTGGVFLLNRKKEWGTIELRDEIKDNTGTAHGFGSVDGRACRLEAATAEAVLAACAGSVSVAFEGSEEFAAIAAAAVRGGSSSSAGDSVPVAAPASSAPVVAGAGSFVVPGVDAVPALASVLSALPVLVDVVNEYASGVGAAVVGGSELPEVPAFINQAAIFRTELPALVDAYRVAIENAGREWLEAKRLEEEKRAAEAAAAEAAAAAAANGKTLIQLADGTTVEVTGKVHPAFSEVCEDLKSGRAVYLYGPAGTGKSYMARQLAEALGVEFYESGRAELKYDLMGSFDAHGGHVYTAFTRAFTEGGLWLFDEMDRSAPGCHTSINDALANGVIDVPGLGMVKMHPNFYCLGAGNTCGFGNSSKYSDAQKIDLSSLTRFLSKIEIGYCREMDMIVSGGDTELCDFAEAVRGAIAATGVELDFAIRALKPLQEKANRRGCLRALECCLFAGVDKVTLAQLSSRCRGKNKWFKALEELAA